MKKITPDPPKGFSSKLQPTPGSTLATAIINSDVLMNACHHFLLSHNSVLDACKACHEDDLKRMLIDSLQNLELAWGQIDALVTALNNAPARWQTGIQVSRPCCGREACLKIIPAGQTGRWPRRRRMHRLPASCS